MAADSSVPWAGLLPAEAEGCYLTSEGAFVLRFGRFSSHVLTATKQLAAH